jgi:dehydrogenase/reductase SDR family protein 7B
MLMLDVPARLLIAVLFTLCALPALSLSATPSSRVLQSMSMSLDATCNQKAASAFSGSTVLLTGASGGLGRAFSLQLAHSKAHTLVLSGRNEEALKSVEHECKTIFPEINTHIIMCDLSDKKSVADLSKKALELCNQRIDILINNGGVSSRSRFLDTKLDVDEKVMQINFFAGAALAKGVVPGMVERGYGKVIWISSIQGLRK